MGFAPPRPRLLQRGVAMGRVLRRGLVRDSLFVAAACTARYSSRLPAQLFYSSRLRAQLFYSSRLCAQLFYSSR